MGDIETASFRSGSNAGTLHPRPRAAAPRATATLFEPVLAGGQALTRTRHEEVALVPQVQGTSTAKEHSGLAFWATSNAWYANVYTRPLVARSCPL